jgi:hypothetical protein
MCACVARRIVDIALFLALIVVVCAVPSYAKAASTQATDPAANSPAGVVYAIPLDSARQDAAPHFMSRHSSGGSAGEGGASGGPPGGGGGSGSAGGSAATSSSGHAGSQPAATAAGVDGGGSHADGQSTAATKTAPILVPGGQPGSLVHSTNGFGSSSTVPGLNGGSSPGLGAVQSNASDAPLLAGVLALILLSMGGYLGARAWRRTPGPGSEASSRA